MEILNFFSGDGAGGFTKINETRFKLEKHDGVAESRLVLESVEMADDGYYRCEGFNILMEEPDVSDALVRVKNKLAPLWPFIGICAEIFVLGLFLFIYEKTRTKTDDDER